MSVPADFLLEYGKHECPISAKQAHARYLQAKQTAPTLTYEAFFRRTDLLQRRREEKANVQVIVVGRCLSGTKAHDELVRSVGRAKGLVSLTTFLRNLKRSGKEEVRVGEIDDLVPLALAQPPPGATQAFRTQIKARLDGRWEQFPNAARLLDALGDIRLSERAFHKRIKALKDERASQDDLLVLSEEDIAGIVGKVQRREDFDAFKEKIESHLKSNPGKLMAVAGMAAGTDLRKAYAAYENQRTLAEFSCRAGHPNYVLDFVHMSRGQGCPICGRLKAAEARRSKGGNDAP